MIPTRLEIPNFDIMDQSDFESLNLAYPPSSSHSFSSASSSFGVFTPTSGRSTSPNSNPETLDFATSFGSAVDSFSYDLTPPSSAISPYFQADVRYEDPCVLYQSRPPVTPSRSHQEFTGHLLNNYNQQTPAQVSSFFPFGAELASSPIPPTPIHGSQFGQSWDTWSTAWPQTDSPIDIVKKEEDSPYTSFPAPAHHGRRLFDDPAKKKTTALRKAQLRGSPTSTGGIRKRTKPSTPPTKALANGLEVPVAECNKVKCDWDGCDLVFKKKEHMVRHKNANHLMISFACQYCSRQFNRSDNFRAHEALHGEKRDSGKVQYVPEAAAKIAEEQRKRARRPSKGRAAKLTTGKAAEALHAILDEID